ncbi:MAG: iron-containing redox enzyme family protein [bacterium]|nr:iron-containing redox enzyme family protein [bacterium]
MNLVIRLRERLARDREAFLAHPTFQAMEAGTAPSSAYVRLAGRIARTHLHSARFLAFLVAVSPPSAFEALRDNMLEELGEHESEPSHADMLREGLRLAGLGPHLDTWEAEALSDLDTRVQEPLLHGSLRDLGFSGLVEVVAFEDFLARTTGRFAALLEAHGGWPPDALGWFHHHSEVDLQHAEEGFSHVAAFVAHHRIPDDEAWMLIDMALRGNVFLARYLDWAETGAGATV